MNPQWNRHGLVPELVVSNLRASLEFWTEVLGFVVQYDRPEDGFALVGREDVAFMLEQWNPDDAASWLTGPLEQPFGRGINFEITVAALEPLLDVLEAASWPFFLPLEERWYRAGASEIGVRQFLVQDPDGYLLRFSESLGERPHRPGAVSAARPHPNPRVWEEPRVRMLDT